MVNLWYFVAVKADRMHNQNRIFGRPEIHRKNCFLFFFKEHGFPYFFAKKIKQRHVELALKLNPFLNGISKTG